MRCKFLGGNLLNKEGLIINRKTTSMIEHEHRLIYTEPAFR